MRRGGPLTPIASFTSISTSTNLSATWTGLAPSTCYEWCVVINDGTAIQSSPLWQFTTCAAQAAPVVREPFSAMLSFDRTAGSLALSWPATAGSVYQVVYRDNVAEGAWIPFSDEIGATGSQLTWTTPVDPSVPHRFFRVNLLR